MKTNLETYRKMNRRGFSLVELLVVVAIISILSVSTYVGFGALGDILRVREVKALLGDLVKQEELKVLRGDFQSATLYFLEDFVVIDEGGEDSTFAIELRGPCLDDSEIEIKFKSSGNVRQEDEAGRVIQIHTVTKDDLECVSFKDSEDREWSYQLTNGSELSNRLRFIHFNLQRENSPGLLKITNNNNFRIEIKSPYGKKRLYQGVDLIDEFTLTIQDEMANSEETITFQTQ